MDVVKSGELVGVEDQSGRVQDQLGGRPCQLLHVPGGRGVRCAKSLSIQYFINILQNSLIDVDIKKKRYSYRYQYNFPNFSLAIAISIFF